jgi:hypothetical protein
MRVFSASQIVSNEKTEAKQHSKSYVDEEAEDNLSIINITDRNLFF